MKIVIANGLNTAAYVIEMFKKRSNELIVINSSRAVASELTKTEHVSVFVGNPWRNYVLQDAGAYDADVFISLCEKDTDNYASCILAKKIFGAKKCICVVNDPANVEIYKKLGIDSVISSTYLLAQNIKSESSMESLIKTLSLENDKIMVIEVPILSKYRIANQRIMDINFPKYASIAAIYRNFAMMIPNGQVELKPKDSLLVVCAPEDQEKLFKFIQQEAVNKESK
jgi:trk system potassium uptake protein TrkA